MARNLHVNPQRATIAGPRIRTKPLSALRLTPAMSTPSPAPIGVKTIDHVTLVVNDLERSAAFYVDLLGMRRVERPTFGFPGLWFQAGNTQIHLILKHDKSSYAGLPDAPPEAAAGRVFHFAFEVSNFEIAVALLQSA